MILDLSEILKNGEGVMPLTVDVDMSSLEFMGEKFTFTSPLSLDGTIKNNSKNLELNLKATGKMQVNCSRCLTPFETDVNFKVKEILMREDQEISPDSDAIFYQGHSVDLTDIIANSFFMNVEGQYLCREDCKGLCQICGTNLNETTCNCEKDVIDPRWAKLAELIKDTTTE